VEGELEIEEEGWLTKEDTFCDRRGSLLNKEVLKGISTGKGEGKYSEEMATKGFRGGKHDARVICRAAENKSSERNRGRGKKT